MTMHELQHQFELLVDGELSFDDEAKLLAAMEDDPSGWKQLALVFLEDRALRSTIGAGSSQTVTTSAATPVVKRSDSERSWRTSLVRICVSGLVLVGVFLCGRYSITPADSNIADVDQLPDSSEIPQDLEVLPPPIEYVSLELGVAGEDVQTVEIPVRSWEQASAAMVGVSQPPSLIPAEVRETLARRGQTVREHTEFYPFQLSDGRIGVIPVSNIEIQARPWPSIQ